MPRALFEVLRIALDRCKMVGIDGSCQAKVVKPIAEGLSPDLCKVWARDDFCLLMKDRIALPSALVF